MREAWRWYGEFDPITLDEVRQTGATSIVTSLHAVPYGEIWPVDDIVSRKSEIESAGFSWDVVESLPVDERIKKADGNLSAIFANYRQSLRHLSEQGINIICYNFMPLLDWTRTDLKAPAAEGAHCLRFDIIQMAAFDVYILQRQEAHLDYDEAVIAAGKAWYDSASQDDKDLLTRSVLAGMPGAFDKLDVDGLRQGLRGYEGIGHAELRANYKRFLDEVMPTAIELGTQLCVHPDDPPRDIFGLPRIVSTEEDIAWIMNAFDHQANGLTLCSGSLGAHPHNDVPQIASRFADRIHFAHLRNVTKQSNGSFEEAQHLAGDTDMAAVIAVLLEEQERRRDEARADHLITFRPDHGHHLASEADRHYVPGYPLYGRLRGLAELRGVIAGLTYQS